MPLIDFVIHLVVGASIFLVIAAAALGIGEIISWLDIQDYFIKEVLSFIKYLIFAIDCLLFGIFLLSSTIKMAKKLWNH
ncbi:hypothetical protein [Nitrosomonas oligotropha]|uniref:Uncharacterized protein n=1 Tax=Nitrosomonas oligotropha TaxID=42354 RepID=A0A1H8UL85_9PROT|nr:hypothetical protein [Nitrosomonas oligotropha]SDW16566.1 hypothetical protein SAMN05216300_10219 [Nitrosomonas oligotropha]SEP03969.1 hypothetical protein SAMN05216333_13719 [Nitrosomonas oligotropha]